MKNYCFDIETAPLGSEALELIAPPFDPNSVKVGNLGGQKAAEKIEKGRADHFTKFMRHAALSPVTGSIVAIGVIGPTDEDLTSAIGCSEETLLRFFFDMFTDSIGTAGGAHWIGFNIAAFDVPFIVRRAWHLKVAIPPELVSRRYLSRAFTDLMEVWKLTGGWNDLISLSDLAQFLGLPPKDSKGAQFVELLRYEPEKAAAYLQNDLRLTWGIADRLGAFKSGPPRFETEALKNRAVEISEPLPGAFKLNFY
jgi:RNase_H superfamily